MTPPLGETYRAGQRRVDAYVRSLLADGRTADDVQVPACPGWTVHAVVSHLAAIPTDALAGRLTGIPDDAFTAGQVAERADRPTAEVLDEWSSRAETFAGVVDQLGILPPVLDVLTHEGDLREALGDAATPPECWHDTYRQLCGALIPGIDGPGSLTVTDGEDTWTGGAGGDGPTASVTVVPWELFRAMMSRRSEAQMRAWAWDGDPDPWLGRLTVFGVRTDDQPLPA